MPACASRSSARLALAAALAWATAAAPARANDPAPAPPGLREAVAGALVRPQGPRFAAYRWPREPEIVALYYGADWCAPCHAFVPELRAVHDALRAAGADTEVVYVSLDASEREMHRYMARQAMPWPAIDHRRVERMPGLRALGGMAPPNLVLLDRDGTVLASGWAGRRYEGLAPVLRAWVERAGAQAVPPP
ncbi:redoxin domain-containing protein [Luteimonas sp. Y-2-2-4F]|nr:thioredoxin-like domain-containing protein [Luteimonas sp. Y-2-2-4F]MCD9031872.1 redoxin domain-containing protein [Luteimonas sp. Y-2-2-4F]